MSDTTSKPIDYATLFKNAKKKKGFPKKPFSTPLKNNTLKPKKQKAPSITFEFPKPKLKPTPVQKIDLTIKPMPTPKGYKPVSYIDESFVISPPSPPSPPSPSSSPSPPEAPTATRHINTKLKALPKSDIEKYYERITKRNPPPPVTRYKKTFKTIPKDFGFLDITVPRKFKQKSLQEIVRDINKNIPNYNIKPF